MADAAKIREIVETVITQVLDTQVLALRDEIVDRVLQQLQPALAPQPGTSTSDLLKTALAAIQEANTQTEILKALLDGAAMFCGRAALFVMRGGTAMGWQARGFRDNDALKILSIDTNAGLAGFALQQRTAVTGPTAQFDPRFVAGFGAPQDGNCLVLPLFIREKVAALVYADHGAQPDVGVDVDASALDLLVRSAGLWVELLALRKSAGIATSPAERVSPSPVAMSAPAAPPADAPMPAAAPHASPPPFSYQAAASGQPAAPAAPVFSYPPAAPNEPPIPASAPPVVPQPPPAQVAPPSPAPAPTPMPDAAVAADDPELHRKARRFAKLLVDEIKLYNQGKVAEGKKHHDLYDRLKEDIDKSRATYDKRYGQTPAAAADYFSQELIRGLAENNAAMLGSNFSR